MCFSNPFAISKSYEANSLLSLGSLNFAPSCPTFFHA